MGEGCSCYSRVTAGGFPACLHAFPSFLSSDYLFKLLLIGDSGVGKSCLLLRFAVSKKPPLASIWGPGWWLEGERAAQSTVVTRPGEPRMKLHDLLATYLTEKGQGAGKLGG